MHPSRPLSGPTNSLNPHDPPHDSPPSFIQPHPGDQPATDWYYPPADDTPAASSSSSMIGPTSTFYNPDDAALQHRSGHEYQQWLDTYGAQPQQAQQIDFQPYSRAAAPPQQEIQNPYDFMQGQYPSSSSLSQYAGSTTGTVTQATVNDSSYFQTTDMYPTAYHADLITATSTSTSSGRPYIHIPTPLNPCINNKQQQQRQQQQQQQQQQQEQQQQQQQQQHQQQQRRPQHPQQLQQQQPQHNRPFPAPQRRPQAPRPAREKPPQPPQFQQAPPLTFLTQRSQVPQTSTAIPQAPSRNVEATYPSKNPVTAAVPTFSPFQYTPPQAGGSKPGPSQTQPAPSVAPPKRTNVTTEPASQPSAPAPAAKLPTPERVSAKRKRAKKNESPEWSGFQSRGDASDSESDDDDGSGLGMSGGIGVGLSGLGVIGRGKREKGSRL
ncbi:hypothetical protein M413DRAFT_25682 [Hebeloma cylindrosporum]|uniref:Uncharacterized protein n=1 Tax=Hebeloma cylindrosporum TaxID=76867 RepID=A0A0C3C5W2_HEBCY|nr:hypothetical protein M413DRAFT_25682 [Hebeloma cylindrosporum h7]